MKITYLSGIRIPSERAHAVHCIKMAEALAKRGHQVELVVAGRYNPEFKNVDVFEFYNLERQFKIKKLLVIDILHWFDKGPFATWLTNLTFAISSFVYVLFNSADLIYSRDRLPLLFISLYKKNFVYEIHEYRSKNKNLYKRLSKRGKGLVVITQSIKELLIKDGIKSNKILVASDAVDLKKFQIETKKNEVRKKLGLPVDKKIILYNGSLYKWKGVCTLVQITRYPLPISRYLIILVGGAEYDINRLKKFIKENNLSESKVLILGHKQYKDMPNYLAAADVLVLPNAGKKILSAKYTSPLKMFEYMASQKPIVASDLPSIREVLNENNAVLVEPDNPQALAQGIQKVLQDLELADKISKQAYIDVQNYTWEKRVKKILEFIK